MGRADPRLAPRGYDPEHFDADEVNDALQERTIDLAGWHPALTALARRVHPAFSPIPALVAEATEERADLSDDDLKAATRRWVPAAGGRAGTVR